MPRVTHNPKTTPIPNNIKYLRESLNLTQNEVAQRLGIPLGSYGVIESGHSLPSRAIYVSLVSLLGCNDPDVYHNLYISDLIRQGAG